jgi:hypothetical protein
MEMRLTFEITRFGYIYNNQLTKIFPINDGDDGIYSWYVKGMDVDPNVSSSNNHIHQVTPRQQEMGL